MAQPTRAPQPVVDVQTAAEGDCVVVVTAKDLTGCAGTRRDDRLRARSLDDFPLYKTFEQNPPFVIDLSIAQVNLLASLTEWVVTNPDVVRDVRAHIPILPAPRSTGASRPASAR